MLWKLGSFIFLILLKRSDCLANPSYLPDNNPSVNIYMSLEEVKKLLGKDDAGLLMDFSALTSFSRQIQAAWFTAIAIHSDTFRFWSWLKYLALVRYSDLFDSKLKEKNSLNLYSICSF